MELIEIKKEINERIGDKDTFDSLLATTFNGLDAAMAKRAMMEGMMRGFTFKDFLEKNVYAVPFAGKYSLVTSIDYARKIGMRSGVVGKSAPTFTYDSEGKIESCTITIKRQVDGYVGEYTDTVFFKEYSTGRNLWASKAHTMIAKVCEAHVLRMACPEELSQSYVEEEYEREPALDFNENTIDVTDYAGKLEEAKTTKELASIWSEIPAKSKMDKELIVKKDEMKAILDTEETEEVVTEG